MEVPFGGPASWWGISAKVFGWPPPAVAGTASAYGWFESAEPFRIVVDGASVVVKASGMSASSGTLGFRVIDGETVVYDVAVEWGWTTEGPYFREVNLLGAWPNSWHTVQEFYALISQVGEFEMTFYPAGLARAEFYVDVEMVALAPTAAESESTSELSDTVSGAFIRPTHIPVSSKWGLTALALLLMAAGAGLIVRRCL